MVPFPTLRENAWKVFPINKNTRVTVDLNDFDIDLNDHNFDDLDFDDLHLDLEHVFGDPGVDDPKPYATFATPCAAQPRWEKMINPY